MNKIFTRRYFLIGMMVLVLLLGTSCAQQEAAETEAAEAETEEQVSVELF